MKIGQYKMANEWMREESATPEEALNTWNELEAEFKANRAMSQEPRSMDQAALVDELVPGPLKDEMLGKFNPDQETYEEYLQRINLERPFNMAEGGQLVKPSVDGSRPGYRGDIEKTKTLNLIKNKMEPLNKGEKLKLYRSYDDLFKQEYKKLVSIGDPFSKIDLNRAVINRIASENPTIDLQKGIGLDKIPGGGNEESKTLFQRYDGSSARGPLFNKKELKNFTQGNAVKATSYTKTQEKIFNAILNGNSDKSSLAKKLKISEGRLDYNIEKLMRNLSKGSGEQYVFLKDFKEKDLEKVRNSIFESPSLEQSYQRTITQSILQSTKLGSLERKKAFEKLKEFRKFKRVMKDNGLDPKLLSMDHAASYRAIKNGNIKSFLSVTPIMKDINTLKSSFDRRSQLNLRRMRDYLLAGDMKNYKYFLKNQTELENLWKTMTGGQSSLGKIRVTATGPQKGKFKIYDYGSTSLLDKNKNLLNELADNLDIRKNIVNASTTKNLDEARRIMLAGSELTEKKMLGTFNKKTDRAATTVIDKSFKRLNKPEMFKVEKKIGKLLNNFWCGTKQLAAGGGRIGFSGSCPVEVKQKNFLKMTNDVSKGKITGKAADQIAKNAGKVIAKAGSKSALASIFGPAGIGIDIAYEVGSIGFDMATDSNISLKNALQNNWLTGAFIKGTGQEEYHKGLVKFDSSSKPMAQIQNLMQKIESEEKQLERVKTDLVRGDYTGEAKKEKIAKQEAVIKNLYKDFDKVARRKNEGPRGENVRYLALEEGSPEQSAYDQAKQEYDSIGEAKAALKKTSEHGFKEAIKSSRAEPWIDYSLSISPQYGKLSKKEIDDRLRQIGDYYDYGYTPYGLGFGMQQMQPGIGDMKYDEDLGYREISDIMTTQDAQDKIATFGGIANMAGGGIASIRRPKAIPPKAGPMPDASGLSTLYNRVKRI